MISFFENLKLPMDYLFECFIDYLFIWILIINLCEYSYQLFNYLNKQVKVALC